MERTFDWLKEFSTQREEKSRVFKNSVFTVYYILIFSSKNKCLSLNTVFEKYLDTRCFICG